MYAVAAVSAWRPETLIREEIKLYQGRRIGLACPLGVAWVIP